MEEMSWCMKYRVYLGVSFFRFFTISLIVFGYKNMYFIFAQLEDNVHEFGIFKDTVEFNNVTLMKGFMNFYFWEELI